MSDAPGAVSLAATAGLRATEVDPIGAHEILLLALLGVAVGTYGTLVGLGGGFLIVPLLLLIYKLPPPAAAATSLVVVFLNAASGTASYLRGRRVDIKTGLVLAVATIPGALIGPAIAERIPHRVFEIVFSTLMLALSGFLLWRPEAKPSEAHARPLRRFHIRRSFIDRSGEEFQYTYSVPLALAISFVVGILSSMLGIGGGIVHVPAMIHLMSFPVHIATATSHFVLVITTAAGVVEYATRGHIAWSIALPIGAGAVVGAPIGARISKRLHGQRIVRLLALAVVVLALRLLLSGIRG